MYRFLDAQGCTQELADEAAVRAAIVDGRIKPTTPFAAGAERWTMAGRHVAYKRNRTPLSGAAVRDGSRSSREPAPHWKKLLAITTPLLVLGLGIYERREDFAGDDHAALVAAATAFAQGEPLPPAVLASPPRRAADRAVWVSITAAHDAEREIEAVEQRYGVLATPAEWLQPAYVRHASAHPQVARYLEAAEKYHITYRDSIVPITERALRLRAAQADLRDEDLDALLAETRTTSRHVRLFFDVQTQWAREARRLHGVLVAAEPSGILVRGTEVFIPQSYAHSQFESSMRRLREIETRREALAAQVGRDVGNDLAKLSGR